MDAVDFELIRELLMDANVSYLDLAERLDIDKTIVKEKADRLFEKKILSEPYVQLNKESFRANLVLFILKFKTSDDKKLVLNQIIENKENYDYEMIINDSTDGLCIFFIYNTKDDLEKISKKISDLQNLKKSKLYTYSYWKKPTSDSEITELDWKIIKELIENRNYDPDEVSKRLGITPRKLKKQIEYLTKNKIIRYNVDFYNVNVPNSITLFLILNIDHYSTTLETILMNKLKNEYFSYYPFKDQLTLIFGLNIGGINDFYKVEEKIKKVKDVIGIKKVIWSNVIYSNNWSKKFVYSKLFKFSGKKKF